MSVKYKSNIDEVISGLKAKTPRAMAAAESGLTKGLELFSSRIVMNQMAGRPGLNVKTGTLRRSWEVNVRRVADDIIGSLGTQTKYAIYHQKPPGSENIAPNIPKRLNILEDFEKKGLSIVSKQVAKALFREYKK